MARHLLAEGMRRKESHLFFRQPFTQTHETFAEIPFPKKQGEGPHVRGEGQTERTLSEFSPQCRDVLPRYPRRPRGPVLVHSALLSLSTSKPNQGTPENDSFSATAFQLFGCFCCPALIGREDPDYFVRASHFGILSRPRASEPVGRAWRFRSA